MYFFYTLSSMIIESGMYLLAVKQLDRGDFVFNKTKMTDKSFLLTQRQTTRKYQYQKVVIDR